MTLEKELRWKRIIETGNKFFDFVPYFVLLIFTHMLQMYFAVAILSVSSHLLVCLTPTTRDISLLMISLRGD